VTNRIAGVENILHVDEILVLGSFIVCRGLAIPSAGMMGVVVLSNWLVGVVHLSTPLRSTLR
jgi:hypothetical protein